MMRWGWLVLVAGVALAAVSCKGRPGGLGAEEPDPDVMGPALFEDITARSGLHFTYRNGEEAGHLAILESLGGGVALLDYDGDGLLDVFLPGGGYYDKTTKDFPRKEAERKPGARAPGIHGHPCKLFKNLGGGKFKDVTKEVGLDKLAGGKPWFFSHGAAVGDFDRDGYPDLLVTGWGRIALFRNVPVNSKDPSRGRRFVDVTAKAGLDRGITWATSAGWADFDGDGYPDLYVCQYTDWSFAKHPACTYDNKTPDVCPPKNFTALPHKVYRNNRDGTFTDVSKEAGLRMPRSDKDYEQLSWLSKDAREQLQKGDKEKEFGKGLGVIIVDVNGDGKPDVYVANDTVDNFLYLNRSTPGKIRFEEMGLYSGVARDDRATPNGSMGVDAGDYEGSGKPALWVTNYENELHALYQNQCDRERISFNFQTSAAGIAAIGQKYVGWGTGFVDVDHDGWPDLFIVNGHAIRYPTGAGVTRRQKPVLLLNRGGKFKEITRRLGSYGAGEHLGRGLALGDLDNDGGVDAIVCHTNEPVAILKATPPAGRHWLGVQLVGHKNADVVGAKVVLEAGGRKQTRFARGGGSYASAPDPRHVFGLGETKKADRLTVIWPNGEKQHFDDLAVDRYHRILQGKKAAEPFGVRK
jgi:hypothetical protein